MILSSLVGIFTCLPNKRSSEVVVLDVLQIKIIYYLLVGNCLTISKHALCE